MGQNPFDIILRSYSCLVQSFQTYASRLLPVKQEENYNHKPLNSVNSSLTLTPSLREPTHVDDAYLYPPSDDVSSVSTSLIKGGYSAPLTKEELGRCTWTLLHMISAQFPERPTRQQKRDAKELMGILSRMYPCKDCADHFKDILRSNPVQAGSREEFSQWLCHVHNVVNRSLGKPVFPCQRVSARWAKLDCGDRGCDVDSGEVTPSP